MVFCIIGLSGSSRCPKKTKNKKKMEVEIVKGALQQFVWLGIAGE